MKTKTYLALSVATTFLLFTTSCSNSNNKTAENVEEKTTEVESLVGKNPTAQAFKHTIPLDAVKAMVNTYETERVSVINNNPQLRSANGENFVDSKSGWVSLSELASFIEEVKADAKNKGVETKDIGVRLYYTVYPKKQEGESEYFKAIENEYRSRQTFLFLPTYHDEASNSEKDILSPGANGNNARFTVQSEICIALNHMALCPPACP